MPKEKPNPYLINSVLYVRANADVEESVRADLQQPDPTPEKIRATLNEKEDPKNTA